MPLEVGLYVVFTSLNIVLRFLNHKVQSKGLNYLASMAHRLSFIFVEMNIVDITFYAILNIFVFHKFSTNTMPKMLSFVTSVFILVTLSYDYGKMLLSMKDETKLSPL